MNLQLLSIQNPLIEKVFFKLGYRLFSDVAHQKQLWLNALPRITAGAWTSTTDLVFTKQRFSHYTIAAPCYSSIMMELNFFLNVTNNKRGFNKNPIEKLVLLCIDQPMYIIDSQN